MTQTLRIQRLAFRTLFKLFCIGLLFAHVAGTLVLFVSVVADVTPAMMAGEKLAPHLGGAVVLIYLVLGLLLVPLWAAVLWCGIAPGLWVYSRIRPVSIAFRPAEEP